MISTEVLEEANATVSYLSRKKSISLEELAEFYSSLFVISNDNILKLAKRVQELEKRVY